MLRFANTNNVWFSIPKCKTIFFCNISNYLVLQHCIYTYIRMYLCVLSPEPTSQFNDHDISIQEIVFSAKRSRSSSAFSPLDCILYVFFQETSIPFSDASLLNFFCQCLKSMVCGNCQINTKNLQHLMAAAILQAINQ